MNLDINDQLYSRLSQRAMKMGFESAEEYSEFVLKTIIDELEANRTDSGVQERLEDLGYLK